MPSDTIRGHFERLHKQLRDNADRLMNRGWKQSARTLQATALVNEAYVRLASQMDRQIPDADFFALASVAMRRVLIEYVRAKYSQKRGGPGRNGGGEDSGPVRTQPTPTSDPNDDYGQSMEGFLTYQAPADRREEVRARNRASYQEFVSKQRGDVGPPDRAMTDEQLGLLHDGLERLHEDKPRAAQIVDMYYFGGLPLEEIGDVLGRGKSTVHEQFHKGMDTLCEYAKD